MTHDHVIRNCDGDILMQQRYASAVIYEREYPSEVMLLISKECTYMSNISSHSRITTCHSDYTRESGFNTHFKTSTNSDHHAVVEGEGAVLYRLERILRT